MKINIYLFLVFLTFAPLEFFGQNTFSIQTVETGTNASFDLNISLQNQDNIAALQFDINYNATAFSLLSGHELTITAPNHILAVSTPSVGIVRVIIYSASNSVINSGSGLLVRLKMKSNSLPGTFGFSFANVVASSTSSATVSISGINQNVVVKGPILTLLTTDMSFGRVPIGSTTTRQISIKNSGNLPLVLGGNNTIAPFTIVDSYPISINPNETKNIIVGINTVAKINTTLNLGFENNDPDSIRNLQSISLAANVYAVNEIHVGDGSGIINSEIEIPIYVNNMESFNGVQFDILLPTDISFVDNSIVPSLRFNGHIITASIVNGNVLRFIAYSSSNVDFKGSSGELFRFKLKPAVSSGTYNLTISNSILSNTALGNIVSDSFNGYIQINSPNLTINPSLVSYGNVPITESRTTDMTLYNSGSSLLIIDSIVKSSSQATIDASLPIEILPGVSKIVKLNYKPINTGSFSETVSFRYNGPDLQKIVNVQATVFSPNYLMVQNQLGYKNQLNNFSIVLKNNDVVRAVQFDVELPAGFTLIPSNITTTTRSTGFTVSASLLSGKTYRVLLYSVSDLSIGLGDGAILNFPVTLSSTLNSGVYSFIYSNVVISNTSNQNISSAALEDGKIMVDAPIAVADQITVAEGGTATTLVGGINNVLTNDTDAENNALTAKLVSGVTNGTLTLNSNGTFSYVHNGSETTSDSFTYKANDGALDSNTITVIITITPVNDAPIAVADQLLVLKGGTATTQVGGAASVLTNDTDVENNTLTAILVSGVTNGTLTLNANGTFSYVHNDSGAMSDSFTYKANDGALDSNTVTVIIEVVNAFTLPSTNFTVQVKDETCTGKNNGEINLTAVESYSYVASINGKVYNFINNSLVVPNLTPGTYAICITIPGKIFEQCYNVNVAKGKTITGKFSTASNKASIEILEGTAPYQIFVNGKEQFETESTIFSVDVKKGDLLEVKTAKSCEGIYSKDVGDLLGTIALYPNPTTGSFEISIPTSRKEVLIDLYTASSQLISKRIYPVLNEKVHLNLEKESLGVYFVKIYLDTPVTLTIIKN